MNSLAESINSHKKQWLWAAWLLEFAVLWIAIATPNLLRSRFAADQAIANLQLHDYGKSPVAGSALGLRSAAMESEVTGKAEGIRL
jgi:hypothetical protein